MKLCFDRGYGKVSFVEALASMGYNITMVANSMWSRHPFILKEEADAQIAKWRKQKVSEDEIAARQDILKDWVIPQDDYLGPETKVAIKKLGESNNKHIQAVSLRDVYDRKTGVKYLRFFCSGNLEESLRHVWIAKNKEVSVPSNTVFCHHKPSAKRKALESLLLAYCHALTVTQRTADWFTLKAGQFGGTAGGKVVRKYNPDAQDQGT